MITTSGWGSSSAGENVYTLPLNRSRIIATRRDHTFSLCDIVKSLYYQMKQQPVQTSFHPSFLGGFFSLRAVQNGAQRNRSGVANSLCFGSSGSEELSTS